MKEDKIAILEDFCQRMPEVEEAAKALFGEKELTFDGKKFKPNKLPYGVIQTAWMKPSWQYHLQQLVLEENRIDYLRKYLESIDD